MLLCSGICAVQGHIAVFRRRHILLRSLQPWVPDVVWCEEQVSAERRRSRLVHDCLVHHDCNFESRIVETGQKSTLGRTAQQLVDVAWRTSVSYCSCLFMCYKMTQYRPIVTNGSVVSLRFCFVRIIWTTRGSWELVAIAEVWGNGFLPAQRYAIARVFATATCLSVCPSVCLSHAGIVPSRAKAGSWNVHYLIAPWL